MFVDVFGAPAALDAEAVRLLNRLTRRSRTVCVAVGFLARWLAGVEILLMVLLGLAGRRRDALRMLLSVGMVYVACELGGMAWPRARPFERIAGVEPLVGHTPGRSFPSRHVASGLVMADIGFRAHPRLGRAMQLIALLLGATRMAAGLHYPSDVLASFVLAQSVTYIMRSYAGRRR